MSALAGIRVLEFEGLGGLPLAGMMAADMGADVVRVARPGGHDISLGRRLERGRTVIEIDLKSESGKAAAVELASRSDAVLEGYRPGVMERLGLGPADLQAQNPGLVYVRLSGWGQSGPMAPRAGHDINYLARSGLLSLLGREGAEPTIPLNILADYAGGGLMAMVGLCAALVERSRSGEGQVIDASMFDGAWLLSSAWHEFAAQGRLGPRGTNPLDGGSAVYDTYRCADGEWLALGALEPKFFHQVLERLGLVDHPALQGAPVEIGRAGREVLREVFATRPRRDWTALFDEIDACCSPVLSLREAREDEHALARQSCVIVDGRPQSAPAPRFSRTPSQARPSIEGSVSHVLDRWSGAAEGD